MIADRLRLVNAPKLLWALTLPVSLLVALAAFGQLLGRSGSGLLIQGPLVVDPTLAERLATIASPSLLHWGQLAIHIVGLVLFVGLGITIAVRSQSELSLVAASMLTALGVSLFAPLNLLDGGWARVARVIGEAAPEAIADYWFSLAGILLLVFLRLFLVKRPRPWETAILGLYIVLGVVGLVWPGAPFLPSNLPSPWGTLLAASIPVVAIARAWISRPARSVRPVLVALTLVVATLGLLLFLRPSLRPDAFGLVLVTPRLQALYGLNTLLLATVAMFALPVSIVLAVVRYRLFDIDVLINRALVYGSLTGLGLLIFAGVSLTMSALAGGLIGSGTTGVRAGQIAAVAGVVTGTAVAVGMQPVRRRLQRAIDRRFYREKFDAEQALGRLVQKLASVVERPVLEREVRELLAETLQPTTVEIIGTEQIADLGEKELAALTTDTVIHDDNGVMIPLAGSDGVAGALVVGPRRAGIPYRGLELQFLAQTANRVGPALRIVDMFERQEASRRQQERVEQELSVARRIQRELLPHSLPTIAGYEVEVFYQPAREVGGDFYDFYSLTNGKLAITVGDVTDKGMPAALVMASCRTVLRGVALSADDLAPGEALARANELLVGDIPRGMFVTCLLALLDPATGEVRFANAGHNPPLHVRATSREIVKARGMPLGLMTGMTYEEATLVIGLGEQTIFTSDGITEAHSTSGEMFGFARMKASGNMADMLSSLASFTNGAEQDDDITVVSLRRGR